MTARAIFDDHGNLQGLADDDHTQYLLLAGRTGGQVAFGGTAAGNILDLQGADASPDTGIIRINSPVTCTYDTQSNTTPAQAFANTWNPTASITGTYIGGYLSVAYNFTVNTGVYVPATFSDTGISAIAANPAFSAYTFINQLHTIRNSGNFNLPSGLVMNIGLVHERNTSGTSTTAGATAVSFAAQTRATVFGAIMTRTTQTGIAMRPTFSTVSGSTVNLGTINAVECFQPAVALFQPQAGVENMTAYNGINFPNFTFGGASAVVNVVNSALNAGTNKRCINHTGTAASDHGGSFNMNADSIQTIYGASGDCGIGWGASGFLFFNFITASPATGQVRLSSEVAGNTTNRYLLQGSVQDSEFNVNCDRFSIGAQSGAIGNGVGAFVTPTRTTAVNGGWADFNLTHAGNITIDDTMSEVVAWNLNSVGLTSGTGSITGHVATFQVGGMTTSGLGGAETHALRITGRRTGRGVDAFEALSPAQLTADVNDYAPATGNAMRQVWRLDSDASRTITGIAVQQDVDTQWITNVGSNNIVLAHQNAGSAASNRMISPTGANLTLGADESALLWHDDTTDRWRILFHTGA